jgi:uncharacterized protein
MRYDDRDQQSQNVEDRRGQGGGGGGFPFPMGGGGRGGFSLTTMLIVGAIMLLFGFNPLDMITGGGGAGNMPNLPQMPRMEPGQRQAGGQTIPGFPSQTGQRQQVPQAQDDMKVFISRVLKDTEDVWEPIFAQFGKRYEKPPLVLFTGRTQTACGTGMSAMGPFYCPADRKVYIDLAFYDELKRRFRAPGDFAQAYVIAHEVGHHVQTLLGIADRVQQMKSRMSQQQSNALQVRMELQASGQEPPRARRRRRRAERSRRYWRRYDPAPAAGLCRTRKLHPRVVTAARALVPSRHGDRPDPTVRYLQRAGSVSVAQPHMVVAPVCSSGRAVRL